MIETTETEEDSKAKQKATTTTTKKRAMETTESSNFDQQKRGRTSAGYTTTTSGTSDFYSVASESESSYQTAGENDDFKPKFLKKLNDTLATGRKTKPNE